MRYMHFQKIYRKRIIPFLLVNFLAIIVKVNINHIDARVNERLEKCKITIK